MDNENRTRERVAEELVQLRHIISEFAAREAKSQIREERIGQINLVKEALLRSGTLQDRLKRVTDGLVAVFDADFARIWITRPGDRCDSGCVHAKVTEGPHVCRHRDRCLHLMASSGRYTHIDGEVHGRVPFGCYKIGRVAAGLEPKFLTNDVARDSRIHDQEWAIKLGLVSFAGFRLLSEEGTPIGVLALFSKHDLSEDDAILIEGMANTAAHTVQTSIVEDALRLNEEMLKSILSASAVGIALIQDGQIKWVNAAWPKLFGFEDQHECVGLNTRSLYPSDAEYERAGSALLKELEKGVVTEADIKFRREDGGVFDANVRMKSLDPSDPEKGTIAVFSDITSRKRALEDLQFQTERFKMLSEMAPFGLVMIAKDGTFEYVNPKFTEIFGYDLGDVPNGRVFYQKAYPDPTYRHEVKSAWIEDVEDQDQRGPASRIFEATCKDGNKKIIHFRSVKLGTGEYLMTCEDITDRMRAEEARRESEARYRVLVETSPDPIILYDLEGNLITVNQQAALAYGVGSPEDLLAEITNVSDIMDEESGKRAAEDLKRTLATGSARKGEYTIIRKNSSAVPVEMNSSIIRTADGAPTAFISVVRDISDRKEAEQKLRESEERFRSTFEQAAVGICHISPDGRFLRVNQKLCEILGYTSAELLSFTFQAITHPDDLGTDLEYVRRVLADEIKTYSMQKRYFRKDGSALWANLTVSLTRDVSGAPRYFISVVEDISSGKMVEEALGQSEEKFRSIVENSLAGLFTVDEAYRFIYVNDELCRILGYSREDLVGLDFREVLTDDSRALVLDRYIRRQRGEKVPSRYEIGVVRGDGEVRQVEMLVTVVRDASGLPRTMGQLIDITERKQSEEALRLRDSAISSSISGIAIADFAGTLTYVNPAALRLWGYVDEGEVLGRRLVEFFVMDGPAAEGWKAALKTGSWVGEVTARRKDGSPVEIQMVATVVRDNVGNPMAIMGSTLDVTDRKRAEQALRESELKYRTLFDESRDAVFMTTREGILIDANQAFRDLFGFTGEEAENMNVLRLYIEPDDRKRLQEKLERESSVKDYEINFRRKDGRELDCLLTSTVRRDKDGKVLGYQGIIRDVTDLKKIQRQLLHAQKMEAIGTLAGGIAHDFNNLLQAILGYTDLLLMGKKASDPDRHKLEIIYQTARNGADLVSRILTLSMKGEFKARPTDLNQEIRRVEKLLRRMIPGMIAIDLVLADDLWVIDADAAQIEQVFLNLAVNAQHAMPDGGRFLIETSNVSTRDEYLRTHLGAKPGKYVLLTVSDTGKGIEPEVVDRIFEPFFTTKAFGEGTGLGLAMVHGIVSQHDGYIGCKSEPGRGTSFKMYFPVSESDRLMDPGETREMPAFGTETILLVDDDARIRDVAREMIEMGGYKVIDAASGEEALETYAAHRGEVSLVLLDLIMPGMGGKRCLEELLRTDPDLKVLFASGYSSDGLTVDETGTGARGFVKKPYDAKDILTAIRKVLDRGYL